MSIHFTPTNPCGHNVSETRSTWIVCGGADVAVASHAKADPSPARLAMALADDSGGAGPLRLLVATALLRDRHRVVAAAATTSGERVHRRLMSLIAAARRWSMRLCAPGPPLSHVENVAPSRAAAQQQLGTCTWSTVVLVQNTAALL